MQCRATIGPPAKRHSNGVSLAPGSIVARFSMFTGYLHVRNILIAVYKIICFVLSLRFSFSKFDRGKLLVIIFNTLMSIVRAR